jgi:hypothetical protein
VEEGVGIRFQVFVILYVNRNCPCDTSANLEKYRRRDVKALAELFHLLAVELSLFLQDQGHNALAAKVVCAKIDHCADRTGGALFCFGLSDLSSLNT